MEELLQKYNQPKSKAPNSPRAEQINTAIQITAKPFKQLAGLTRHLSVQQLFLLNKESKGAGELWWYLLKNKYMDRTKNKTYQEVKEKLEKFPEFRERSKRDPFLTLLALRSIGIKATFNDLTHTLNLLQMSEFAIKFGTYGRYWRAVTEDNPQLQGSDYLNKEQSEALTKNNLGYK